MGSPPKCRVLHSEPGTKGNPSQYFRSQAVAFEEQSELFEKRFGTSLCRPGGIMKSTLLTSVLVSALCFFSASPAARGQGVASSGLIRGAVTDPAGALVPNATITAEEPEMECGGRGESARKGAFFLRKQR